MMFRCFLVLSALILGAAGNSPLNATAIRLADGSGPFEGRVEIKVNGVWGTICHDYFDWNDATVLCRMLNSSYGSTAYFHSARYGQGVGPIFVDRLHCNGYETHIQQCSYQSGSGCWHGEDVSLICSACGRISLSNAAVKSISSDGSTLEVECNSGDISTSICNSAGDWSTSNLCPVPLISNVNLTNGVGLFDGRVEVLINGTWRDVCSGSFSAGAAATICNILFGLPYYTYRTYDYYAGSSNGYGYNNEASEHINKLQCIGNETDINDCYFEMTHYCYYEYRTSVVCNAYPLNITDIRLADGPSYNVGRVEIKHGDIWGTICDSNLGSYDSYALCRMLNLSYTTHYTDDRFGSGAGPVLIGELRCDSYSEHINDCYAYTPPLKWACTGYDVAIACTECGEPDIPHGQITSSNGSFITVTCDAAYVPSEYTIECLNNGTWLQNETCTLFVPLISNVKLTDGVGLFDGRVEVLINGTWRDVCSDSFNAGAAATICNILFGLPYYTYRTYDYYAGSSNGYGYNNEASEHINKLQCIGNETDINDCYFEMTDYCYYEYRTSVVCNAYPLNITDIRLADGPSYNAGRVEIKHGDIWGTICDSNLGSYDSYALCRMLNLSYTTHYTDDRFGSGAGPVLIGELRCDSYSEHINDCYSYLPPVKWFCTHDRDIALACTECGEPDIPHGQITSSNGSFITVTCGAAYVPSEYTIECLNNGTWLQNETCTLFGYPLNITNMTLLNGIGLYDGILAVEVDGNSWGTVCMNSFGSYEARTICSIMFGTTSYRTYHQASWYSYVYGVESGPIYIDQLDCQGTETDINQCKYNVLNTCEHSSDVVIACNVAPLNITSIRLTNGTSQYNGRVEVLVDGLWGSVCNSGMNIYTASTICNMMDFRLGTYYTTPVFGVGNGPMHLGYLNCYYNIYQDISQCAQYSPYRGSCTENDELSIECIDRSNNITDVRLVPGPYYGRIEVKANEMWGTVCDDNFNGGDGDVICRQVNASGVRSVYYGAYYGEGTGPVHINWLTCDGNEEDINDCTSLYNHTCGHNEDASVLCYGPKLNITGVRLANGTGENDGRAEIEVNGTWGTICDRNFDINDADAFCNMLGLRAAQYLTGATHGGGTGPIHIEELFCNSYDENLNDCKYVNADWCSHDRDVSIVCNECGPPEIHHWDIGYFSYQGNTLYADCSYYKTYMGTLSMICDNDTNTWVTSGECEEYSFPLDVSEIRLSNGNASSGRVEIKFKDTWGTVCDDNFGWEEANVICKMLGKWPAVAFYPNAEYGGGTGPIFIDDLDCPDGAEHINNCSYVTYDNCYHNDDVSVVCLVCGDPTPENGIINSSQINVGAVIEVSCETGYRLIGNNTINCTIHGTWSDQPNCQLIDCKSPQPEHGAVNSSSTTNGTIVSVTCNTGYNLSGEAIITCQPNDEWTDYPSCDILDCGLPVASNADIDLPSNTTTYGAIAVVSCKPGYLRNGSSTVACLDNGEWDEMPECDIVDCGDPTPNKGSRNDTASTFGTVVEITCDNGLDIIGNSVIVCQTDGSWTDSPVCEANDCGRPSISNAQVDVSNGTTTGSIATTACNPGYDLVSSGVIVCNGSHWNHTSVKCDLQDCGIIVLENGVVVSSTGTKYGDTATFECNEGYDMEGDPTISCQDGGSWTDVIVCTIKDCGSLDSITNGQLDISSGTTYKSTAEFACDDGFKLVGDTELVCRSDGSWSSDPPVCIELAEIGEACFTADDCKTNGAQCTSSVCTCRTGVHDSRTTKCDTMPLYPYGEDENDIRLNSWEQCGDVVHFSLGLPALGREHTDVFVCPHGVVSFDQRYNNPTPPKSTGDAEDLKYDIIAPFHAHFQSLSISNVYYRAYDVLNSYKTLKERSETRDIEKRVQQFGALSSFEASFVLIATWENVMANDRSLRHKESGPSTFQLVLTSDGELTYSFFIYGNGLMRFESKRRRYAPVLVGYFSNTYDAFIHHNSYTPIVLTLDSAATHAGVSGIVFKSLVRVGNSTKNNKVNCVKWYQENKHEKQDIDFMNSLLPQCPCDISLARWDPWFWHIDRWSWWYGRKNFTCVDMLSGGIYRSYGKSCCYDYRTSLWVDERPTAGGFFRYHQDYQADHYIHDTKPKEMCCSPFTSLCRLYYKLRPIGTCYRQSPYNFGSFWGDPHFSTLDGLNFTFNGLGEYTLLQIQTENHTFSLQARTQRAIKQDGNLSDATVFSAFAARDGTNASIHVELNRAKRGFNIYGNDVDLTEQYIQKTDNDSPMLQVPNGTLIVAKRGETLVVSFPESHISLNISVSVEMLSLNTMVHASFHNVTRGLLGNFNGIYEDDFILPNGTVLPANLTEREVFHYGQFWEIDAEHSAFKYEDGKNHTDYHNATYVPRFLDEADPIKRQEAEVECDGSENIECVFDIVFTERKDAGLATKMLKKSADLTKKDMDEVVPLLNGCGTIYIGVNEIVQCNISIEDENDVEFLSNNVNASFDRNTSSITYYQVNDEPVDIKVVSKNENGRSSTAFTVDVLLCTGCSGHGFCSNSSRNNPKNTDHFHYATCVCEPHYEGPNCENVFDGCVENPCSLGRKCTSLDITERIQLNRKYLCDVCPDGFTSNNEFNDTCSDYDECEEDNPCDHTCVNTEGSYECVCNEGYRTDTNDEHKCTDINECEDLNTPHNCTQNCINTDGAFECSCYNGFSFESGECIQNTSAVSACETTSLNCSLAAGCTEDEDGIATCFCDNGFELDNTNTCKDIMECDRNTCPQECINTVGGFQCICFDGFKLDSRTTCRECDVGFWGENCRNECRCTGEGVKSCNHIKGCICEDGWQGDTCDEDIDECTTDVDVCDDPRKECKNLPGSFQCLCQDGFTAQSNGTCADIDECSVPSLHTCEQLCTNAYGSYSCECNSGFISNGSNCKDIDECSIKTDGCEQICNNNPGSYNCFCYEEYILNDDRRTCTKLSDPCLTINGLNCSHYCYISTDDAECRCKQGYTLGSDNQTCTDDDECTTGLHDCDANSYCKNTDGSYTCDCFVGSKLENNGRTCTECDDFHYGKNCVNECNCLHGVCDKIQGCNCDYGWRGDNCDIDIDECASGQQMCLNPNEMCVNTRGNATCRCLDGYSKNESGTCEDVNECSNVRLNTCDQKCVNVPGGYKCECQTGFLLTDGKCEDINECENRKSDCEQICENTLGSYRCYCEDGFKLNQIDRKTCIVSSACSDPTICGNYSTCLNINGNDTCRCLNGYHKVNGICEDINECSQTPNPCHHNCSNIQGSYTCSCNRGYLLTNDYTTCKVCTSGTYGENCSQDCACNEFNSESCDHISGNCTCKKGWEGTECNDDINECYISDTCPDHSTCNNTRGGYDCNCDIGYLKTSTGMCTVCDENHFGKDCVEECTCVMVNTESCNRTNGDCECKEGWTGIDCSEDINECDLNLEVCLMKENSTCYNTHGSYQCVCDVGYTDIEDQCTVCTSGTYGENCSQDCACNEFNSESCDHISGNCTCKKGWEGTECNDDINECDITDTCPDHSTCNNTHGGYDCQCDIGYFKTSVGVCTVCDESHFGEDCAEDCTCVMVNTESCNRTNGNCECKEGWEDIDCSEDINECDLNLEVCLLKGNSTCYNTHGSYQCVCDVGFSDIEDQCIVCISGTYGENCSLDCTCNESNSESCDRISGNCTCKKGWEGTECNDDINECYISDTCPDHSTCNNTHGGYDCHCEIGYFKTSAGVCTECDESHFGKDCAEDCTCVMVNTESCNKTNGNCECKEGWTGVDCSVDINECDLDSEVCLLKENSTCYNTHGSHQCVCDVGYTDIEDQCTECSDHTFGNNCTETCACNVSNTVHVETDTQSCDRLTGSCECLPNWEGSECNDDVNECLDEEICSARPHSGCANTIGSYRCECYRGYNLENAECVPDDTITTTPLPVSGLRFEFVLSIGIQLDDSEDLDVPSTYDKYHDEMLTSLVMLYKQYTMVDLVIRINSLSKGSLVVSYSVQYEENDAAVATALVEVTKEITDSSEFIFNGEKYNANITSESFDPSDNVCKIIEAVGTCEPDTCVEVNGTASCKSVPSSGLSRPQIIGISVGCVLFATLAMMLLINFVRRWNKKKKLSKKQNFRGNLVKSLAAIPSAEHQENIRNEQHDNLGRRAPRTWRTMITRWNPTKVDEKTYEPYKIPRASVSQPTMLSTKTYNYF